MFRAVGEALTQNGPMEVSAGVLGAFTVTDIVLTLAHWPTVGVKVSVWLPPPAVPGLKELPATPGPDQEPVMPLCVVFRAIGGLVAQNGPMEVSAGVLGAFTVTDIVLTLAHWPTFGVKVSVWLPPPAVPGLKELPATPGPDQEPVMPLCVVFRAIGGLVAQNGPMEVSAGVLGAFTVTDIVLTLAHWPTFGVKVSVWLPAPAVAGLKELPATPGPDQEPVMPLWVVFKAAGASVAQKGPMDVSAGVLGAFTVTDVVLTLAHWPTFGVKVSVWLPAPAVAGLKELPATPGPDQEPVMPLWVVFKAAGASVAQKGPMEVSAGVLAAFTVTEVVLTLAHWPAAGVKVSVWLPAPAVAGLKEFPETPGPDQFPVMPLCVVFRAAGASVAQKGPMDVSAGVVAAFTVTEVVLRLAHWPAFGVKVIVWLPAPAVAGLKELPETPGPDQFPVMPLCVAFRAAGASVAQKDPMDVRAGVLKAFTVTEVVLRLAHWPAVGVKVSVWLPAPAVAGLNEFPDTPGPDQSPVIPLCVVFRAAGASVAQKDPMEVSAGVLAPFTVTEVVLILAHWPAVGVKVSVWLPAPAVAGLNEFPDTPGPDQSPVIPLCVVFRAAGASVAQKDPMEVSAGVLAPFTVTEVVLTLAHWSAFGVKVSVWLPAPAVAGLKEFPETPGPDQEPGMPLWVVFRAAGEALAQKGPMEVSAGVTGVFSVTVTVTVMVY